MCRLRHLSYFREPERLRWPMERQYWMEKQTVLPVCSMSGGKAAVGMSETEAADTLASTSGSALMIAAGSTLYGTTTVGSTATGTAGTGSSLTVGSDGTLIIKAGKRLQRNRSAGDGR